EEAQCSQGENQIRMRLADSGFFHFENTLERIFGLLQLPLGKVYVPEIIQCSRTIKANARSRRYLQDLLKKLLGLAVISQPIMDDSDTFKHLCHEAWIGLRNGLDQLQCLVQKSLCNLIVALKGVEHSNVVQHKRGTAIVGQSLIDR